MNKAGGSQTSEVSVLKQKSVTVYHLFCNLQMQRGQHPPRRCLRLMEVERRVSSVQTGPQVNTTVHPAVMAARASSGGAFATTTRTTVGEFQPVSPLNFSQH